VAQVLEFRTNDQAAIDSACLDRLCRQMGNRAAEAYLTDVIEDISDRMAAIDDLHRSGLHPVIRTEALRIANLGADIGLTGLASTARDLSVAAERGDMVAYRAIWQRLVRIGDRSLAQVWDAPGLSM